MNSDMIANEIAAAFQKTFASFIQIVSDRFEIPHDELEKYVNEDVLANLKTILKRTGKANEKKSNKQCAYIKDDIQCENMTATVRGKYCEEHKGKRCSKSVAAKELKTCKKDGCENKAYSARASYCEEHSSAKKKASTPKKKKGEPKVCKKDGCEAHVTTPRAQYCEEHRPQKKKKAEAPAEPKVCAHKDCEEQVTNPHPMAKYCDKHKKVKKEAPPEEEKPTKKVMKAPKPKKPSHPRADMGPKTLAKTLIKELGGVEAVNDSELSDLVERGLPEEIYQIAHGVLLQQAKEKHFFVEKKFNPELYHDLPLSELTAQAPFKDIGDLQDVLSAEFLIDEDVLSYFRSFLNRVAPAKAEPAEAQE